MVFWVPKMLPILSPHLLDASTQPLSDGVALSLRNTELQDRLGRLAGGVFRSPSPGWSSEPVLGVCGNCPAPIMVAGCLRFDSELYLPRPQKRLLRSKTHASQIKYVTPPIWKMSLGLAEVGDPLSILM